MTVNEINRIDYIYIYIYAYANAYSQLCFITQVFKNEYRMTSQVKLKPDSHFLLPISYILFSYLIAQHRPSTYSLAAKSSPSVLNWIMISRPPDSLRAEPDWTGLDWPSHQDNLNWFPFPRRATRSNAAHEANKQASTQTSNWQKVLSSNFFQQHDQFLDLS